MGVHGLFPLNWCVPWIQGVNSMGTFSKRKSGQVEWESNSEFPHHSQLHLSSACLGVKDVCCCPQTDLKMSLGATFKNLAFE